MRRYVGSVQLAAAGLAFAIYPVLRGYGSEVGLDGAALYARPEWVYAHVLGMVGFALLARGLTAVDDRAAGWATWGAFAVLPYYGAEAFGLHALGRRILQTGAVDMVTAASMFRYQPLALALFGGGLLLLAVVGVRLIMLGWRAAGLHRWGLGLTGVALAIYLPQFFLPGPFRVGHGLLLCVGLLLIAARGTSRPSDREPVASAVG